MKTNEIYENITSSIMSMLDNHIKSEFKGCWLNISMGNVFAKNIVSKHVYRGVNQFILAEFVKEYNYKLNNWLTFSQISNLNGKIKKGSKSAFVVFSSKLYFDLITNKNITKIINEMLEINEKVNFDKINVVPYLKYYNVFNVEQVENLPDEYYKTKEIEKLSEPERIIKAEQIIENSEVEIYFRPQNDAFYDFENDKIVIPERKQFFNSDLFYVTCFHEMAHWTSHPKRLKRNISFVQGSKEYAFEELVAELTSAFVCATLGIEKHITENVSYIQSWLKIMNDDKRFVVSAASKAQEAADYIIAFCKPDLKKLEKYAELEI